MQKKRKRRTGSFPDPEPDLNQALHRLIFSYIQIVVAARTFKTLTKLHFLPAENLQVKEWLQGFGRFGDDTRISEKTVDYFKKFYKTTFFLFSHKQLFR